MCVAIYKPADVQTPSLETLKQCWEMNPDGAGFALRTNGKYAIEIHKGYMTWKSFVRAFKQYGLADFTGELLLHFRVATHGGINKGNTHPFSLTQDVKLLKHTNVLTNYALIHNGVLPLKPSRKDISDTMELCTRLDGLQSNIPAIFKLIEGLAGDNKIAVMSKDKVHLFGHWEKVDGVYFSNLYWNWFDDYDEPELITDELDLIQLKNGHCPYCQGRVIQDHELYECAKCYALWTTEDYSMYAGTD